jgi:hypothetical protein
VELGEAGEEGLVSRFYYAPRDPGHGSFGAAIAAGMGQGIQNLQQGQMRQEEQRRYEAQMEWRAKQDAMAAADRRFRYHMLGGRVVPRAAPPQFSMEGALDPRLMPPAPNEVPEGRLPGASLQAAVGLPAAPSAIQREAGAFIGAPPPEQAPVLGLAIPQVLQSGMDFRTQAPAGDHIMRAVIDGEEWDFDPTRAYDFQQAEIREQRQEAKAEEKRGEIQMMLTEIAADGIVTPNERAWLVANGLRESDLQDPEKAEQKAWGRWLQEQKMLLQFDLTRINARNQFERNQITGGRDLTLRLDNLRGTIEDMHERNMSPSAISAALIAEGYDSLTGGVGGLNREVRATIQALDTQISPRAMAEAQQALLMQGLINGTPGYEEAFWPAARRAQEQISRDRPRIFEGNDVPPISEAGDSNRFDFFGRGPASATSRAMTPPAATAAAAPRAAAPAPAVPGVDRVAELVRGGMSEMEAVRAVAAELRGQGPVAQPQQQAPQGVGFNRFVPAPAPAPAAAPAPARTPAPTPAQRASDLGMGATAAAMGARNSPPARVEAPVLARTPAPEQRPTETTRWSSDELDRRWGDMFHGSFSPFSPGASRRELEGAHKDREAILRLRHRIERVAGTPAERELLPGMRQDLARREAALQAKMERMAR